MTYELAKELKDAGFPQPSLYDTPNGTWCWANPDDKDDIERAYVPTLEELIQACEPSDNTSVGLMISKTISTASKRDKVVHGSTPIVAVAKLWLALN